MMPREEFGKDPHHALDHPSLRDLGLGLVVIDGVDVPIHGLELAADVEAGLCHKRPAIVRTCGSVFVAPEGNERQREARQPNHDRLKRSSRLRAGPRSPSLVKRTAQRASGHR